MPSFSSLHREARRELLRGPLDAFLATIDRKSTVTTKTIAIALAPMAEGTVDMVGRVISSLAADHPQAVHGPTAMRHFDSVIYPWIWIGTAEPLPIVEEEDLWTIDPIEEEEEEW